LASCPPPDASAELILTPWRRPVACRSRAASAAGRWGSMRAARGPAASAGLSSSAAVTTTSWRRPRRPVVFASRGSGMLSGSWHAESQARASGGPRMRRFGYQRVQRCDVSGPQL